MFMVCPIPPKSGNRTLLFLITITYLVGRWVQALPEISVRQGSSSLQDSKITGMYWCSTQIMCAAMVKTWSHMVYGHPFQAMGILIIRTFFSIPMKMVWLFPPKDWVSNPTNLTRLDYGTCGGFLSHGYLPSKLIQFFIGVSMKDQPASSS